MIALLGEATISLETGATYIDAGATATDDVDGDITPSIAVLNPVDTATPGTYTVIYDVSDSSGNQAQAVTRTVNIIEPAPAPAAPEGGEPSPDAGLEGSEPSPDSSGLEPTPEPSPEPASTEPAP